MKYIANWKMSNSTNEFKEFFEKFIRLYKHDKAKEIVFCPSFIDIIEFISYLNKYNLNKIEVGTQNVSHFTNLNNTGEISAKMIRESGAKYCIVGHSERRIFFNESNKQINIKINELIKNDVTPILCVGETLKEKERECSQKVVKQQLTDCLKNIKILNKILIAYEPVWAIGSGKSASGEDISLINSEINSHMNKLGYNDDEFYILYGGSVNMSNLSNIISVDMLDGFLIGGASLKPDIFWDLIKTNKEQ